MFRISSEVDLYVRITINLVIRHTPWTKSAFDPIMSREVEAIKLIISRFQSRANSEAKDIPNSILAAFDKETCNKTAQQIKPTLTKISQ